MTSFMEKNDKKTLIKTENNQQNEHIHVVLSSDDEETTPQNDKQLVLYNPTSKNDDIIPPLPSHGKDIVPVSVSEHPEPLQCRALPPQPRVLPSVGAFTVQCAECFKWRLIPSKEKYEEIREHILSRPFKCERAKEWRPSISCEEPADIEQDGSRLWAIDKPNIAQPPPGWERELRIRSEGASKFADVYYIAPTGKRLRSMVEVHKYLMEHPEYIRQGVTLSQFSFQIPKPLQENYVRKRNPRLTAHCDETLNVNPLSWAAPDDSTALQLTGPGDSDSYCRDTPFGGVNPPPKKKPRSSSKHMFSRDPLHDQQHRVKFKGPRSPTNGIYDL